MNKQKEKTMSYEIFTGIKYNKTTKNFDCSSYSNNVWPHKASKWEMDYYAKNYPNATEQEVKALFILSGLYSGNKYATGIKWAKDMEKAARLWTSDKELSGDEYNSMEVAKQFLDFYNDYTSKPVNKYGLLSAAGYWINKINRNTYKQSVLKSDAKVFEARCKDEVKEMPGVSWFVDKAGFMIVEL